MVSFCHVLLIPFKKREIDLENQLKVVPVNLGHGEAKKSCPFWHCTDGISWLPEEFPIKERKKVATRLRGIGQAVKLSNTLQLQTISAELNSF